MPNWCFNSAEISHPDPAKIDELLIVIKAGSAFNHFVPMPDNQWDRGWCIDHWGTKWEMSEPISIDRKSPTELMLSFDTAWSPPLGIFEAMKKAGYTVRAEYTEEGMAFAGYWNDGDDECYDMDELPDHLSHLKPTDWDEPSAEEMMIEASNQAHEAATNRE